MLTSKAKYALRAMIDLATQTGEGPRRPFFIGDIAQRQDIPRRFLENILLELRKHGLVVSHRGKAGGYALARSPDLITFADVIRAIDGPLALTPCTSRTAYQRCEDCRDETICTLRKTLVKVRDASAAILESTTLAEAAKSPTEATAGGKADAPPAKAKPSSAA
ncbi:MAG: Rrf2 family transcriptional regulator [Hyphomonadaceae bacterium]|nr:Rrf2 family transcriptional regulator [Hyphomonadaceae bacterium]